MSVNAEWYAAHLAKIGAIVELPFGASNVRVWRASYAQDEQMSIATLACRDDGMRQVRVVRKFFSADTTDPMTPAEIVAFLGLADVAPAAVEWVETKVTKSDLQVVTSLPRLAPIQRRGHD